MRIIQSKTVVTQSRAILNMWYVNSGFSSALHCAMYAKCMKDGRVVVEIRKVATRELCMLAAYNWQSDKVPAKKEVNSAH